MPKLLSLNNYHYRRGGSDVVYLEHSELFNGLGWDTAFFSMHHPKNISSQWSEYFVDELEFGNSYTLLDKVKLASKSIYSLEAKRKLNLLLEHFVPDVAHSHCIYHHLSPSVLPVLKQHGIPSVMTAHDLKIACPAYKMLNSNGICEKCRDGSVLNVIANRCIRNSMSASIVVAIESAIQRHYEIYKNQLDAIVVPSKFFMNKFIEWGWHKEKFEYIPNYVDADSFSAEYSPGAYFLYFGRLAPEKGIETLLRSAIHANVKLKIVGTGPEENALKELHSTLGGDVEFLGYKSGYELHGLIHNSKAVVLPSEWYENAPMSVLESFAMGKPVIGANIGGIPEMVIDGVTGWIFESGNIEQLKEVLKRVNHLPTSAVAELGKTARQFVINSFSKKKYIDSTLSLYSRLGVK